MQAPHEIDARLAELTEERGKASSTVAHYRREAERRRVDVATYAREIEAAEERVERATAAIEPLAAIYSANPWPRWFPCLNTDGHLHTSLRCSTLHPRSRMGWATELSGRDAESVVAEYGTDVCTVCVPSAPVLPQPAYGSKSAQEKAAARAEREAKRAAREEKRRANTLVEPVADLSGRPLHTVTEARGEVSDCLPYALGLHRADHYRPGLQADAQATLARVKAALAAKLGEPAVLELVARAEKRVRREWRAA